MKTKKTGGQNFGRAVTEREVRREKGERNRKQRPDRKEEKERERSRSKVRKKIIHFGFPAAAPLSPPWPSATTIQHRHSATSSVANASRTREGEEKQNRTERKKTRGVERGKKKNHRRPSSARQRHRCSSSPQPPVAPSREKEEDSRNRKKQQSKKKHRERRRKGATTTPAASSRHHPCRLRCRQRRYHSR